MPALLRRQLLGRLPWFAPLFFRAFFFRAFLAMEASFRTLAQSPIVVGRSGRPGLTRSRSVI